MAGTKARRWGWVAGVLAVFWLVGQCGSDDSPTPDPTAATTREPSAASTPPPLSVTATPSAHPSHRPSRRAAPKPVVAHKPHAPAAGGALATLAALEVKGRAPMTGYTREEFGQAWLDANRNGCDTRNDILTRDLTHRAYDPSTHGCVVLTGSLADPYTGVVMAFRRGYGDDVDIDHVVALGNAWVTGADRWDIHKRAALANDPLNLLAVDAHENRQKGDGDAATWLPESRGYRCAYVARQIAVKRKYGLWVTAPEKAAMARVLSGCPGQALPPDPTHAPTWVDQNISEPTPAPTTSAPRSLVGGAGVVYANCTAARAAGVTPLHVGDPGYSRKLDRDGDGIACE